MWTDEKGVKHFSNTALSEQGKSIRQEGEIKFDEAKQQEILEQQRVSKDNEAKIQADADQKKASFREEYERELQKKRIRDAVYGSDYLYRLPPIHTQIKNPDISPPIKNPDISPPVKFDNSVMEKMEMERVARDAARDEIKKEKDKRWIYKSYGRP